MVCIADLPVNPGNGEDRIKVCSIFIMCLFLGVITDSCAGTPRYTRNVNTAASDNWKGGTFEKRVRCKPRSSNNTNDTSVFIADSFQKTGKASFYGDKFHGRKTASGEKYDRSLFTAAHRTFPFGTVVKVTNNNNGRSVVVRINDRGPHTRGRIVDLSHIAAEKIGMIQNGVVPVTIEIVNSSQ